MPARRVNASEPEPLERRVATTPEGRENQLIAKAFDLAEKQLEDGTASSQVISHFLKAGSTRDYLEKQRLAMDVELMEAKREMMERNAHIEDLYTNAIEAMRSYQGARIEPGLD